MLKIKFWNRLLAASVALWMLFLLVVYVFFPDRIECCNTMDTSSFCLHCFCVLIFPHLVFLVIFLASLKMISACRQGELRKPADLSAKLEVLKVQIESKSRQIRRNRAEMDRISVQLEELQLELESWVDEKIPEIVLEVEKERKEKARDSDEISNLEV